jgi:hypothetical protein
MSNQPGQPQPDLVDPAQLALQLESLRSRIVALLEAWAGLNAADPAAGEMLTMIDAQARTLQQLLDQLGEQIETLPPRARDPLIKRWQTLARQMQVILEDVDEDEPSPTRAGAVDKRAFSAMIQALNAQALALARQAAAGYTIDHKRQADALLVQLHELADQATQADPNNLENARLLADTRLDLDFVRRGATGTHSLRLRL